MSMYSWIHRITSPRTLTTSFISFKQRIILRMIILSIRPYVFWKVGQNKVHPFTQTLSDAKLELFCQSFEVFVVEEAKRSHLLHERTHCRSLLFVQSQRRGELIIIHGIFFFSAFFSCAPAPASVFSEVFPFSFSSAFFSLISCPSSQT